MSRTLTKATFADTLDRTQLLTYLAALPHLELLEAVTAKTLRAATLHARAATKPASGSTPHHARLGCRMPSDPPLADAVPALEDKRFDRRHMSHMPGRSGWRVEGYWHSTAPAAEHADNLPTPVAHERPFAEQSEFVRRLRAIEAQAGAEGGTSSIRRMVYDGASVSRMTGRRLSGAEYHDRKAQIAWPADFLPHYVEQYHVRPSREFFDYVMAFPLPRASAVA
jgi:hypothetical protein